MPRLSAACCWLLLLIGSFPRVLPGQENRLAVADASSTVSSPEVLLKREDLPEELAELIEAGAVAIDFYRQRRSDQRYDGETRFKLNLSYRFRSYARLLQTDRQSGVSRFNVSLRFRGVKVDLRNEMLLPEYLDGDWDSRLTLHEFDHVRLNANPRIRELALKLLESINRIVVDVPVGRQPNEQDIQKALEPKIQAIVDAMTGLVQSQNDLLDQITSHGVNSEPLEPNFFKRAFSEPMLEELEFEFLDEVRTLVRSARYQRLDEQ